MKKLILGVLAGITLIAQTQAMETPDEEAQTTTSAKIKKKPKKTRVQCCLKALGKCYTWCASSSRRRPYKSLLDGINSNDNRHVEKVLAIIVEREKQKCQTRSRLEPTEGQKNTSRAFDKSLLASEQKFLDLEKKVSRFPLNKSIFSLLLGAGEMTLGFGEIILLAASSSFGWSDKLFDALPLTITAATSLALLRAGGSNLYTGLQNKPAILAADNAGEIYQKLLLNYKTVYGQDVEIPTLENNEDV